MLEITFIGKSVFAVKPISDFELTSLILSLEEFFFFFFDVDTRKLQIVVYGELLFIKYLW